MRIKKHLKAAAAIVLAGVMLLSAGCGQRRPGIVSGSSSRPGSQIITITHQDAPTTGDPVSTVGTRTEFSPAVNTSGYWSSSPRPVSPADHQYMRASEFDAQYEAIAAQIMQAQASSANGVAQTICDLCDDLDDMYMAADTYYTFCAMDYHMHEGDSSYLSEYRAWDAQYSTLMARDREIYHDLLQGPYGAEVSAHIGQAYTDYYNSVDVGSNAQLASLRSQENDLIEQYYQIAGTYGTMGVDAYNNAIYNIYAQLVAIRQQIADAYGYETYADYAYENTYGRDFTPDEVDSFYNSIVRYWVPATDQFAQLVEQYDLSTSGGPSWSDDDVLGLLHSMASGLSDDYRDLEQYMEDNDLVYLNGVDGSGGVTIDLARYGSAALFAGGTDSLDLLSTLVHEFGHYANDCYADDNYASYDIQEVHSTGMQVLSTWFADDTLGEYGKDYVAQTVHFLLWYTGSQAATDAFERDVYRHYAQTGQMYSLQELNSIYGRYFTECGYPNTGDDMWTEDEFLFDYPCYSLSYSISAATSLSMLAGMSNDFEGTVDNYMRLVAQTDVAGYVEAVTQSGMPNVLDDAQSQQTAQAVIEYMTEFCQSGSGHGGGSSSGEDSAPAHPEVNENGHPVYK